MLAGGNKNKAASGEGNFSGLKLSESYIYKIYKFLVDFFSNESKAIFRGFLYKKSIANIKNDVESIKPIVILVTPVSKLPDVV